MSQSSRSARDVELNEALEALHFAFRAVVANPDALLAKHGLSRVHHRILYFVGQHPGLSVNELLQTLSVTKQSLNSPLRTLVDKNFVCASPDINDRRVKRLSLTERGRRLEQLLSGDQRARFARVFAEVGERDERAWRRVMAKLCE